MADRAADLLDAMLASDRAVAEAVIDDALQRGEDGIAVIDDLLAPVSPPPAAPA